MILIDTVREHEMTLPESCAVSGNLWESLFVFFYLHMTFSKFNYFLLPHFSIIRTVCLHTINYNCPGECKHVDFLL